MISCDKIEEIVSLALDGEASKSEIETLEEHLRNCGTCREYRNRQLEIDGALESALGGYRQTLVVPQITPRHSFRALSTVAAAAVFLTALGLGGIGGYLMRGPVSRKAVPGPSPDPAAETAIRTGQLPAALPVEAEPTWQVTEATIPVAEELVWDRHNGLKSARHYRRRKINTVRIPTRDFELEWGSTDHEVRLVGLEE